MTNSLSYQELNLFNSLISDYLAKRPEIQQFVSGFSDLDSIEQTIEERKQFSQSQRALLVSHLETDRDQFGTKQLEHLDLLKEDNTFTVVTAHQPNILFGPLYFLLKTISTINLARSLTNKFPDINVVPVFVIGSEDHDTEELNHITLFNRKLTWNDDQKGAFGRRKLHGLDGIRNELFDIFGQSPYAEELKNVVANVYMSCETVGTATKLLLTKMFAKEGLLVIDPDDTELKRSFVPVMKKELLEQFSQPLVKQSSEELERLDYKTQVTGRNINLFYLNKNSRDRIEKTSNGFQTSDESVQWNETEVLKELEEHPERFSPNVILRPVYQEHILPNLVYFGGGGELSYWFQLKRVFEKCGIPFPQLVLRNHVVVIKESQNKKLKDLGLQLSDLFKEKDRVINNWVRSNGDIDVSLHKEEQVMRQIYEGIISKYGKLDGSLQSMANAQLQQHVKLIKGLEKRIFKMQKSRSEIQINQINKLFDSIFPDNTLQERKVNFMEFYLKYGPDFIQQLVDELNPYEPAIKLIHLKA